MKPVLQSRIGKLSLKNPVMVASGTFGYAEEFRDFLDLKDLGAIVTKTITLQPRQGNPMPRTCETPSGLLNSIGLENPGADVFIREKLPLLSRLGPPVIVSIASEGGRDEFVALAERLGSMREVAAIELNISCPNLKNSAHNVVISQDARATFETVRLVRRVFKKTLITKLSPNVTSITEIALAAERAGSDAVSLINTISGMSIDIGSRTAKLASLTGGLSGPAIRPIALKMVWETHRALRIPVIGMGGIMDAESALEFFIAGASAVSVGTANFVNPRVCLEIVAGLKTYLKNHGLGSVKELIGSLDG